MLGSCWVQPVSKNKTKTKTRKVLADMHFGSLAPSAVEVRIQLNDNISISPAQIIWGPVECKIRDKGRGSFLTGFLLSSSVPLPSALLLSLSPSPAPPRDLAAPGSPQAALWQAAPTLICCSGPGLPCSSGSPQTRPLGAPLASGRFK